MTFAFQVLLRAPCRRLSSPLPSLLWWLITHSLARHVIRGQATIHRRPSWRTTWHSALEMCNVGSIYRWYTARCCSEYRDTDTSRYFYPSITDLLGPFHGAIAVPSVTRCRCCCRRRRYRGHRCAGGVRQLRHLMNGNVKRLAVANGPNIFQMLLIDNEWRFFVWNFNRLPFYCTIIYYAFYALTTR